MEQARQADEAVPFFRHDLGSLELEAIREVLAGDILTTGDYVRGFEEKFAKYLNIAEVIGLSSCTGALHLALIGLGLKPGDEVITTPMTFVATVTAIMCAQGKPVFVDVEAETGNMDVNKIRAVITDKTRFIMPVHLYGQMCDMGALRALADEYNLKIIEDSAHCIEGHRDGIRPGQLSEAACFSFYATKNMTSGEGGALATRHEDLCRRLRTLSQHGMTKNANDRYKEGYRHWDVLELGWKYNMDNLQGALLNCQMSRLDEKLRARQQRAHYYRQRLMELSGVEMPAVLDGVGHAWHLMTVWLDPELRDSIILALQKEKIGCVVNYRAVHGLTYFSQQLGCSKSDFAIAADIGDRTLSLPFYPTMSYQQIDRVIVALERALAAHA